MLQVPWEGVVVPLLEGEGRRMGAALREAATSGHLPDLSVTRLLGARNNMVYRWQRPGQTLCVKVFSADDRGRDGREWTSLQLLAGTASLELPRPVSYLPAPPPPVLVMTLVEGESLGGRALDLGQLEGLGRTLRRLYGLRPPAGMPAVATSPLAMAARVRRELAWEGWPSEMSWAVTAARAWMACERPERWLDVPLDRWGRGDPSLGNCLWDGRRVGLVDFEYAGRTDPVYELADLVEHPQSRSTTPDVWDDFVGVFELNRQLLRRWRVARRVLAVYWLCRVARLDEPGVGGRRADQARRVQELLEAS